MRYSEINIFLSNYTEYSESDSTQMIQHESDKWELFEDQRPFRQVSIKGL